MSIQLGLVGLPLFSHTLLVFSSFGEPMWRFMGSYKWSYKSPNNGFEFYTVTAVDKKLLYPMQGTLDFLFRYALFRVISDTRQV